MIEEMMIHGCPAVKARRHCRQVRPAPATRLATTTLTPRSPATKPSVARQQLSHGPRIEWDTPIIPEIIADAVCEEVSVWLQEPLPREWVRELADRANTVYARNEQFRRRIRGAGDRGRDRLWAFMRHWLAARLRTLRHDLYARIPASFSVGGNLPEHSPRTRG